MIDVIASISIPTIVFDLCRTRMPITHHKDTVLEA